MRNLIYCEEILKLDKEKSEDNLVEITYENGDKINKEMEHWRNNVIGYYFQEDKEKDTWTVTMLGDNSFYTTKGQNNAEIIASLEMIKALLLKIDNTEKNIYLEIITNIIMRIKDILELEEDKNINSNKSEDDDIIRYQQENNNVESQSKIEVITEINSNNNIKTGNNYEN